MKPEIKEKWLTALRGGGYSQGKNHLRCNDSYCCLGILSDLYSKDAGGIWSDPDASGVRHIENDRGILPYCIMRWAGLDEGNPMVDYGNDRKSLSQLNDSGIPFGEIADIIEKQL